MTRRVAWIVAIAAALVVVAVLSLYPLRTDRPAPDTAALPTPTPTATATAAATASPSPTAAADRFGYVLFTDGNSARIEVRRERDGAPVFELVGAYPAVSADGKRLAYWRTTPDVGATDLRVLEVADHTSDRSVLALTAQTLGGAVVWSNDGQGLLVATYSRETVGGPGPERGPAQYSLVMLDLTTTPPGMRTAATPLSGGAVFLPVAWDRPGQIAAAVVTGPGGYAVEYATWNASAASPFARVPIPTESGEARVRTLLLVQSVHGSPDGKLVMGLESSRNVLRVWPILDVTKADFVRHPAIISGISPLWRPGATGPYEVIWGVGQKVDLFRYQTDSSTTLYTSTGSVAPAVVRPDGSAVLIAESVLRGATPPPAPPPTSSQLVLVDIATRQATDIGTFTNNLRLLSRGVLLR